MHHICDTIANIIIVLDVLIIIGCLIYWARKPEQHNQYYNNLSTLSEAEELYIKTRRM